MFLLVIACKINAVDTPATPPAVIQPKRARVFWSRAQPDRLKILCSMLERMSTTAPVLRSFKAAIAVAAELSSISFATRCASISRTRRDLRYPVPIWPIPGRGKLCAWKTPDTEPRRKYAAFRCSPWNEVETGRAKCQAGTLPRDSKLQAGLSRTAVPGRKYVKQPFAVCHRSCRQTSWDDPTRGIKFPESGPSCTDR